LQAVTVVEAGRVREELQFKLRDWLKQEDLFEYGVTPQFLSRFDAMVLLEPLGVDELLHVFVSAGDSALRQSAAYFKSQGIRLEVTEQAARRIAEEAAKKPRLGARALKEVFRRVIRPYEFDPSKAPVADGVLRLDRAAIDQALSAGAPAGGSATSAAGWDATGGGVPWGDIKGE
jgi:ATP-dependent Clp protease ATP-binding subunit ClpX